LNQANYGLAIEKLLDPHRLLLQTCEKTVALPIRISPT